VKAARLAATRRKEEQDERDRRWGKHRNNLPSRTCRGDEVMGHGQCVDGSTVLLLPDDDRVRFLDGAGSPGSDWPVLRSLDGVPQRMTSEFLEHLAARAVRKEAPMPRSWLRPGEVADLLDLTYGTVLAYCQQGIIVNTQARTDGGHRRIYVTHLLAFVGTLHLPDDELARFQAALAVLRQHQVDESASA
jgi:hypothetical protein